MLLLGVKNKDMKKFKQAALIELILLFVVYLLEAFILAELNPFVWTIDKRGLLVFLWIIQLGFMPLIIFTLNDKDND